MKQRLLTFLLATTALLSVTACLEYEEVLTLNADGSGHIVLHISVDRQILNQMEGIANPEAGPSDEAPGDTRALCSEDDIRAALQALGSGLELVTYKETDTEEQLAYDIEFNFGDYDDFRDLNDVCPEEGVDSEAESQFDFSYEEQPDGSWLFTRRFGGMDASTEELADDPYDQVAAWDDEAEPAGVAVDTTEDGDLPEPLDLAGLAEKLKGLGDALKGANAAGSGESDSLAGRLSEALTGITAGVQMMAQDAKDDVVRLVVHFPGDVIESNGTAEDAGTVIWEYTLDAMARAPKSATAKVRP